MTDPIIKHMKKFFPDYPMDDLQDIEEMKKEMASILLNLFDKFPQQRVMAFLLCESLLYYFFEAKGGLQAISGILSSGVTQANTVYEFYENHYLSYEEFLKSRG